MTVTTRVEDPERFTRHYAASVADTLMAIPPVLVLAVLSGSAPLCCGGGNGGTASSEDGLLPLKLLFVSASVAAGFSASHGYREVKTCRALQTESPEDWVQSASPPELQP